MANSRKIAAYFLSVCLVLTIAGCATVPKDALRVGPQSIKQRQLQTRKFDAKNEKDILSASVGVLQDLGFTIRDSESKVGVISASKTADATNAGMTTLAVAADILSALAGTYSNNLQNQDKVQEIRGSVVTIPSADTSKMLVRVTFQRVVTNVAGQVSRLETIDDPKIYQGFFDKLSKSVFLEAEAI